MADQKESVLPVATSVGAADGLYLVQAGISKQVTFSNLRASVGEGLSNAAPAQQTGFAADQYLTGSAITIPTAGAWVAGAIYRAAFDMAKTAAGVATPIITVRMGTTGTTADGAIGTFTFGAGTAAADTGTFEVHLMFRSVGAGSAAVLVGWCRGVHQLATTGLFNNAAVWPLKLVSAGFNSTTQSVLGLSFNGGAAFAGTCDSSYADMDKQ